MIAKRLFTSFKNASLSSALNLNRVNNYAVICTTHNIRYLYSKSTLGIDGFVTQAETVNRQMGNIAEKFKEKMSEYVTGEKNMIFTEDLKNMIHLSSTDEDIKLVVNMIKKFNQQNTQMRFGNYIFGPVVMRLLHHFNKADIALDIFKAPELHGFFDQLMSYQLLLDLLYENEKYSDMLDVYQLIRDKQLEGMKYPRNIVVLTLAACYKINTKESFQFAIKLWEELKNVGHFPMRRATTFCAGLAYNQGEPGIALEVLTSARNQNYTTVRNLKVAALVSVGRVENAIPILKSVLSIDTPETTHFTANKDMHYENRHTFNREVIELVRSAVAKLDNLDLISEFDKTEKLLQEHGHIVDNSIDEQLTQEIQKPPFLRTPQQQNRMRRTDQRTRPNRYYTFRQRPGLNELV